MELDTNGDKDLSKGWLIRYINSFHSGALASAFVIGNIAAAFLLGSMDQLNLTELKDLKFDWDPKLQTIISQIYNDDDSLVHLSGKSALQNIAHIKAAIKDSSSALENYSPEVGVDYSTEWPIDELAKSFKAIAQLIKMEVGLRVVTVDID